MNLNELEHGKWYKTKWLDEDSWFCFDKIKNGWVCCIYRLNFNCLVSKWLFTTNSSFPSYEKITLATEKEIKKIKAKYL